MGLAVPLRLHRAEIRSGSAGHGRRRAQRSINCSHYATDGATFVFGPLADPAGKDGFVFAFAILPTIIFMAAFFAVLYHFGIMQVIINGAAWLMTRLMGVSGAESLDVAASIFMGQTEAPLTIRPSSRN